MRNGLNLFHESLEIPNCEDFIFDSFTKDFTDIAACESYSYRTIQVLFYIYSDYFCYALNFSCLQLENRPPSDQFIN